jgi:hypothetical protein
MHRGYVVFPGLRHIWGAQPHREKCLPCPEPWLYNHCNHIVPGPYITCQQLVNRPLPLLARIRDILRCVTDLKVVVSIFTYKWYLSKYVGHRYIDRIKRSAVGRSIYRLQGGNLKPSRGLVSGKLRTSWAMLGIWKEVTKPKVLELKAVFSVSPFCEILWL